MFVGVYNISSKLKAMGTSFGASSEFEKNRLILTVKTLDAPDQRALRNILSTFAGEDQETRSQVAFATIVKKIYTSDSNDSWIYLLKNLIIFDKVIGEKQFLEQISQLDIPKLSGYIEKNPRNLALQTNKIIRDYWRLIQKKAQILSTRKNVIYFTRSLRYDFLSSLQFDDVLLQIESLEELFTLCFVLIYDLSCQKTAQTAIQQAKKQLQNSKLISYIYLQLLYMLMTYYSCQLLCAKRIVSIMCNAGLENKLVIAISEKSLKKFKNSMVKFKNVAKDIINFVDRKKDIKGFEVVNYKQLDPFREYDILKTIENYVSHKEQIDTFQPNVEKLILGEDYQYLMKVEKRPNESDVKSSRQPRLKILAEISQKKDNAYRYWVNSYNDQFPQKQIMTVHLMMMLRKEKEQNYIAEEPVIYGSRDSCIYNYKQIPNIDNLTYRKPNSANKQREPFENIFSSLPFEWISTEKVN